MGKARKFSSRSETCMEPFEGPLRMAAAIEELVLLIETVVNSGYQVTEEQAEAFSQLVITADMENARGADYGLGLQRAAANLRALKEQQAAERPPIDTNLSPGLL